LAGRTEVSKCKKADTDDCAASFAWKDESSGLARLCFGPEDGETKCSDTEVEGCLPPPSPPPPSPPPLTCNDLAGRTEIPDKSCRKADSGDCSSFFKWKDAASGVARLCHGPEPGSSKCSGQLVSGCALPSVPPFAPPPTPPPPSAPPPLTCSDLAGRVEINKCKKADSEACHDYYEVKNAAKHKYKLCYAEEGESKCVRMKSITCLPTNAPTTIV